VGLFANPNMIEYLSGDKKTSAVSVTGIFSAAGLNSPSQLGKQAFAALCIIIWNIIGTYIVLKIVSLIFPLRASDGDVEGGDLAIHGVDPVPLTLPTNGTPPVPTAAV